MRMIKEQFISWFKKDFDWMRAGLTEKEVTVPVQVMKLILSTILWPAFFIGISGINPSWGESVRFNGSYKIGAGLSNDSGTVTVSGSSNRPCSADTSGVSLNGIGVGSGLSWGRSSNGAYQGIEIGQPGSDVIVVFEGLMHTNNSIIRQASLILAFNVFFAQNGMWSGSIATKLLNSPSSRFMWVPVNAVDPVNPEAELSEGRYDLRARLYIGPNAVPGTYSIPELYPSFTCNIFNFGSLVLPSTIVVREDPQECTVTVSPLSISPSGPVMQSRIASTIDSGSIQVRGSCISEGISTKGNIQFSIIANNPTSSTTGGVDSALALLNTNNAPVARVTFGMSDISTPLNVTGSKYTIPVQWNNINFDVTYSMFDLGPSDIPAYGVGRGTAKFIVEWP